ncbi:uncharacterized protein LOC131079339 isoform X2 [Cryptomeria japonica]|uniref:uncharacterized protein LOC131079339 isoform X2 n=1 Tax=Cryptomeria japonica TaxID=3369 RepID=UPI0027DA9651|nr:uncharacterized protein LOC131079339 isoform X2 [Cryptomeria japonica]
MNKIFSSKSKGSRRPDFSCYGGIVSKPSRAFSQNSKNSSVQSNSTVSKSQTNGTFSKSQLSPYSSENQEFYLNNSVVPTTRHGYMGAKNSLVDPELSSVSGTRGENSLRERFDQEKSGFKGSNTSNSAASCAVSEICESHLSLADSGSPVLLPVINDASSLTAENHLTLQSNSLDTKAASDPFYVHETFEAVTDSDKFQEDEIEENDVTEDTYLININEGLIGTSVLTRKAHSTSVQATYKRGLHNILLAHSAAFFYKPESLQSGDSMICDSIIQLNKYLRDSKTEVEAGVPGKFLSIVIGKELPDLGSIVSVITYAYYLKTMTKCNQMCPVPIINMKRGDLPLFPEVKWLFESCCIEQASLIFIDEINLSYYNQFGSLKMVLVNTQTVSLTQEMFKDAIVEVLNCKQMASCCTFLAENFVLSSPTTLAGHGLSRLLLGGILLDTANLTSPQCTDKDKCMATLLIKGARQTGCNGFFLLCGPSGSSFKGEMVSAGMSSVGVSISELLSRGDSVIEEIVNFMKTQKLFFMVIVTGYYDNLQKFKRELVIAGENVDNINSLVHFFSTHALRLKPKRILQSDFQDFIKAFTIGNAIVSRNRIEILLDEFICRTVLQ